MQPAMFEPPGPDPDAVPQQCDRCPTSVTATVDGLRVRGWVAYNGMSFTGKPMRVRLCPTCRQGV